MPMRRFLLTTAVCALAHPACAQVANTYCAQNPAACQPVASAAPAYGGYAPGGYAPGGYGGYAPGGYGGYAPGGYGRGYGGYGGGGYGGYPPPGYYGPGGQVQSQSLAAISNGQQIRPGQDGNIPFPPNQASQSPAPAPPHPENPNLSRYSAGVFSDANRPSKVVQRTGRSAGIQAGYAEESKRIAEYTATPEISARLDARYPFESVMIGPDVVPPVVSELRGIRQTPNRTVLLTTLGSFEILRQARVTVTPPNWRDYLTVTPPPEPAPTWTPPKTDAEQANWDVGYKGGYEIGIAQARAAFDDGLARLDRDLSGMRRYHGLAEKGAVSLPVIKTSAKRLRISRDGQSAAVGTRNLTLTVSPKFQRTASAASPSE